MFGVHQFFFPLDWPHFRAAAGLKIAQLHQKRETGLPAAREKVAGELQAAEKQLADLNQYQTAAEVINMAERNTIFPHHRPGQPQS